jgi:hypothetical protein
MSKTTYIQSVPAKDADNDSLSDKLETEGIPVGFGVSIQTNASNPDTDGDGLEDGNEILQNEVVYHPSAIGGTFYRMRSDPTDPHTDDDLLNDSKEVRGWNVSTINKTVSYNGTTRDIYRWDRQNEDNDSIHVTADPIDNDTDDDGISDLGEKQLIHSDPRRPVTYGLTLEHQRDIVDELEDNGDRRTARSVRKIGIADDYQSLQELHLTDKTDDFDLVYDRESSETGLELLVYRSYPSKLDPRGDRRGEYTRRTDTWLNNSEEPLSLPATEGGAEPEWDPDIDDDGLTEGQEAVAITKAEYQSGGTYTSEGWKVRHAGRLNNYDTRPVEADTDGDGYWDGWVGVYNTSNSRNVILYPENLKDGDGIEAGERVDEQVGTHRIAEAPTPTDRYAVINEEKRHSNLHMGELHWETNPADDGDAAYEQTELRLEVDYHARADDKALAVLNSTNSTVPTTYALYGMNITFDVDDEIMDTEDASVDSRSHAQDIEDDHHDQADSTAYYFITKRWPGKDVEGVTSTNGNDYAHLGYGVFILTDNLASSKVDHAHTSVHEIGHLLGAGRLDDKTLHTLAPDIGKGEIKPDLSEGEVYSGGDIDKSKEIVKLEGDVERRWSTMSTGEDPIDDKPMSGNYIAFSIEEILMLEFKYIATRGNYEEIIDI